MYRSAARRLLPVLCRGYGHKDCPVGFSPSTIRPFSTPGNDQRNHFNPSYPSSYERHDSRASTRTASTINWDEEHARVLRASLNHVITSGWTDAAMIKGARDIGVSPSVVGSFPQKEAALVEFFMDDCLQRLIDIIDTRDDLKNLIPSDRVAKLIRSCLEMKAPYISKWPQALSIQALPLNVSTSLKQRAMLVDEICRASGDEATNIDWYVRRTILGGIYSTTELYMLTDSSPDFQDTWVYLDGRVRDAFDLKKTFQEAKHLAETVGDSVQGFVKRITRVE